MAYFGLRGRRVYILRLKKGGDRRRTDGANQKRLGNGNFKQSFREAGRRIFITPGTIHAIGGGCVIAEVQQSSNITYRLYDYGRRGADGAGRELHIEKGAACADLAPPAPVTPPRGFLAACEYFSVKKRIVKGAAAGFVSGESFLSILILEGTGRIKAGDEEIDVVKGDSVFLAANAGEYVITGACEVLETTAGKRASLQK